MTLEEKAYAYDQICKMIDNGIDTRIEQYLFVHALIYGIYWKTRFSDKIYKAEPKSLQYFHRKKEDVDDDEGRFLRIVDSYLALGKNFDLTNYGYDWAVYQDDFE